MQFITFKNLTDKGGDMCCHGIPYAEFDRTGRYVVRSPVRDKSYAVIQNVYQYF